MKTKAQESNSMTLAIPLLKRSQLFVICVIITLQLHLSSEGIKCDSVHNTKLHELSLQPSSLHSHRLQANLLSLENPSNNSSDSFQKPYSRPGNNRGYSGGQHFLKSAKPNNSIHLNLRRTKADIKRKGSKFGGIFAGFLIGPILFFISFAMIWFNQKRAVIDHRRLKLAQSICLQVNPFRRDQITNANMKLTHITGNSTTTETIGDRASGIHNSSAIKITRKVEVMEWRAIIKQQNDTNIVQYHLGWQTKNESTVEDRQNSPANWFMQSETFYNPKVFVGEYLMSQSQKEQCNKAVPISLTMEHAQQIGRSMNVQNRANVASVDVDSTHIYFPPQGSTNTKEHGALRVEYCYCPIGAISLIAKTVENSFQAFPIAEYEGNGVIEKNELPACCCLSNCIAQLLRPVEQINQVEEQLMSKNQMIQKAINTSKTYTLLIRILSFVLMVAGICIFFGPITTLLGYIPLVGGILKSTAGFIIFLGAVIVCIPLFIITISIAWLFYHPKVGIPILLIGIAGIIALVVLNVSMRNGKT